jgi:hypothetical protein
MSNADEFFGGAMKTRFVWTTATAAVLALGLTAKAQTPPPPSQPDRPRDTMAQSDTQKEITLTGCVQKADQTSSPSSTSPSGSTPPTSARSGSDDAKYILANASMGSGASGATGTAGSTPSASPAGGMTYKLKGEEDDLAKFVGQRVEVRGRLDDKMSSSGSTPSGSTPSASADKILKVSSVRASSSGGSCSESR